MLEEGCRRPYFVTFSFGGKAYVLLIYLGVFDLRRRYEEFGQTYLFRTGRPRSFMKSVKLCQGNKWQQMQRWERTQKGFRFGNHFRCFLLWYIEVCYDMLFLHTFTFTLLLFCILLEFPERFFFNTFFFHIDFLVFSVMFSFQFVLVPFSLMIFVWYTFVLAYVQTCSSIHQGSWLHPKDGVFSHAQSKQQGCGCLRYNAKCYHSSKFSYVAIYSSSIHFVLTVRSLYISLYTLSGLH